MSTNPYHPPKSSVEFQQAPILVPDALAKKIKNCWVAGLISIAITLAFMLFALGGANPLQMSVWTLCDVAVMAALCFGVYKKSRICAVLLLSQFLLNKVVMWSQSGQLSGLPMALVFFWFFGQGVVGTFQYHKLVKASASNA